MIGWLTLAVLTVWCPLASIRLGKWFAHRIREAELRRELDEWGDRT